MKNVEKAGRIHLGSLIENLKKGHYVIPDFQREFEWQPWDVLDLIKSIFMDYYIGTLLLWKGSKYNFNLLSCQPIYSYKGKSDPQDIVLDGQQRLTAIYYAFFQPNIEFPRRAKPVVFFLNIQALLGQDFENALQYDSLTKRNLTLLENTSLQYEQHTFPLGIIREGSWGTVDWIRGYRDYWRDKSETESNDIEGNNQKKEEALAYSLRAEEFKMTIEDLLNNYYISYIELDREIEIEKVCEIFTKINSKGIGLDIFDLLNAILRPKNIYLKQMWLDIEKDLAYTDSKKMKIYILQVMSILEQAYCSAKYLYYLVPGAIKTIKLPDGSKEQKVLIKTPEEFIERWETSTNALRKAIKSLKNPRDLGAIQPGFVPYPSIIPVFAAIKEYVDKNRFPNKLDIQTKIRKWYWASIFTNRYSSSVESTSAKDFQDLKKWFSDDNKEPDMINEFIETYRTIDLLNDNVKGSAIYNAIYNLFVINEARDWSRFDLPEYDTLDDHHIVPHSVFHEQAGKSINSILNRTPLSSTTNRHIIKNRMPNEYLKEMLDNNDEEKVYTILGSHLISRKAVAILLRNPFAKDDFDEFLKERQETIYNAIDEQLIREKVVIPVNLKILNGEIESIEYKLRELIVDKAGDEFKDYKQFTPEHIKEKVEKRINSHIKREPGLSYDDFSSFNSRLRYFDISEYYDIIVSKSNWETFSELFDSKQQLEIRFNQLSRLRNSIRHSRIVTKIEKLDGEAAIVWFKQILE